MRLLTIVVPYQDNSYFLPKNTLKLITLYTRWFYQTTCKQFQSPTMHKTRKYFLYYFKTGNTTIIISILYCTYIHYKQFTGLQVKTIHKFSLQPILLSKMYIFKRMYLNKYTFYWNNFNIAQNDEFTIIFNRTNMKYRQTHCS